ncbi:MAG: nucleotide disphospho-sugar-binding domain-containing protein [Microthrixaceae bacterium]
MPVVRAVVDRGHDVIVVAGPSIRRPNPPPAASPRLVDRLRDAGARVEQLLDEPLHPLDGFVLGAAIFGRTPTSLYGAVDAGRIARWSLPWAERFAPVIDRVQPDALVCDFFLSGALAAGEAAGIPTAALVHNCTVGWPLPGLPLPPPGASPRGGPRGWVRDRLWAATYRHIAGRDGAVHLDAARAALGLSPLRASPDEQVMRADRVLVLGTRALEFPLRGPVPENVRYVGTILEDDASASWEPGPDGEQPRVLVSLSTLPQGQTPVMRSVLEAVGGLPIRAVVTLGPAMTQESFDVPANVQVETFVPHEAVLPHVAAVITQCGLGTISKVLARGRPMVCLPVLGDQPANAARIERLGAGLRLSPDAPPAEIRDAIRRVLDQPTFRVAAERYASAVEREDPRQAVVDELESLLPTAPSVRPPRPTPRPTPRPS